MSGRGFGPDSLLADVLDHAEARGVIQRTLPGVVNSPLLIQLRRRTLGKITAAGPYARLSPAQLDDLWRELAALDAGDPGVRSDPPAIAPNPHYEPAGTPRGSAGVLSAPAMAEVWAIWELALTGPDHGNPFVDVDLRARATAPDGSTRRLGGFYDGDGIWRVRLLPDQAGRWVVTTEATTPSLDGVTVELTAAAGAGRGPVRVADRYHFSYADGTRHLPLGTTAYAWTHQSEALQEQTLRTLAASPFTKIRMGIFPKSYLFNANEPPLYPFEPDGDAGSDHTRFNPAYFRAFERRIADLAAIGVEADVILFHAYDRWGFSDMGTAADDRYVRYVVRRLSALPNVWWSLANEYDLLFSKTVDDWERLAAIVVEEDPVGHLLSIHNCFRFYDYGRPWITHASAQRIDVYRTAENTDQWREEWGKPVVIDECAYEGDIDQGWGNITGEEMTRRFWEGAVRGGYVGHGETYLNDREELWWSKGGELVGSSPDRIAFLRRIIEESPTGVLDPLPSDWDTPWGGVASRYLIAYFGFNRPSYRDVTMEAGTVWTVDVIDTWNMTVETLPGTYSGSFRAPLPARQYMAIRCVATDADQPTGPPGTGRSPV
ncbi:DUF5605 domain-containing protein [Nonomuraea sp. NPDC052116]|uniref:DUF5605 domain-containing protein n=1 Tax=Nonomuraea sp. NPDC052116 TaxID=3155665 RepID=UPI003426DCFB